MQSAEGEAEKVWVQKLMFLVSTQFALMTILALVLATTHDEPTMTVAFGFATSLGSLLAVFVAELILFGQGLFIATQDESTFVHGVALCLKIVGFLTLTCVCCVAILCCYFYRLEGAYRKSRIQIIESLERILWQNIQYSDGGAMITECAICYEIFTADQEVL
jgi:hypothetical protein